MGKRKNRKKNNKPVNPPAPVDHSANSKRGKDGSTVINKAVSDPTENKTCNYTAAKCGEKLNSGPKSVQITAGSDMNIQLSDSLPKSTQVAAERVPSNLGTKVSPFTGPLKCNIDFSETKQEGKIRTFTGVKTYTDGDAEVFENENDLFWCSSNVDRDGYKKKQSRGRKDIAIPKQVQSLSLSNSNDIKLNTIYDSISIEKQVAVVTPLNKVLKDSSLSTCSIPKNHTLVGKNDYLMSKMGERENRFGSFNSTSTESGAIMKKDITNGLREENLHQSVLPGDNNRLMKFRAVGDGRTGKPIDFLCDSTEKTCGKPYTSRVSIDKGKLTTVYPHVPATQRNDPWNPRKLLKDALNEWLLVRNESIRRLRILNVSVSNSNKFFDTAQLYCKYGSVASKQSKCSALNWQWDLASSVGSFVCDMAGGVSSLLQMFNVDSIQCWFRAIMDDDAVATKKMYEQRSKYADEYRYTDEIMRKFDGTTLGDTLWKISESVGITEFFRQMKKASDNSEDLVQAAARAVGDIVKQNCSRDVGREVAEAVQDLVENNPACVETVCGVGKSLYGAVDLRLVPVRRVGKIGAVVRIGSLAVDSALLRQERKDIQELEDKLKYGSETPLQRQIMETHDMFTQEKEEMMELLRTL